MRIVTADEIVAAFEKTGLKPKQKSYRCEPTDSEPACGCALGALYASETGHAFRGDIVSWINTQFDHDEKYAIINGFDGKSPDGEYQATHPNYLAGREAAKRLGLPVEE